jgi:hypothetical protein
LVASGSRNASLQALNAQANQIVDRTLHHANRLTIVPGNPLPVRLPRSMGLGGAR